MTYTRVVRAYVDTVVAAGKSEEQKADMDDVPIANSQFEMAFWYATLDGPAWQVIWACMGCSTPSGFAEAAMANPSRLKIVVKAMVQ